MKRAYHQIVYTVPWDMERGGCLPYGQSQKVFSALSVKQQDLSILSKGECFGGEGPRID